MKHAKYFEVPLFHHLRSIRFVHHGLHYERTI